MRAAIERCSAAKADPIARLRLHLPGWEGSIARLRLCTTPAHPVLNFGNFLFDPTSVTPIELLPQR